MVKLTENKVAEIDTSALEKRARDIRDAVVTKSVTVEMVGSLFADLITACGNVRDALALFLDTNVQEITNDIDNRLAGVDAAAKAAAAETQKSEATRALVDNLVGLLSTQNVSAPHTSGSERLPKGGDAWQPATPSHRRKGTARLWHRFAAFHRRRRSAGGDTRRLHRPAEGGSGQGQCGGHRENEYLQDADHRGSAATHQTDKRRHEAGRQR